MSKINVEFPAFNFDWSSSVQIQWLQTYEHICGSGQDKADSTLTLALDTIVQKNAEYDQLAAVATQLAEACRLGDPQQPTDGPALLRSVSLTFGARSEWPALLRGKAKAEQAALVAYDKLIDEKN